MAIYRQKLGICEIVSRYAGNSNHPDFHLHITIYLSFIISSHLAGVGLLNNWLRLTHGNTRTRQRDGWIFHLSTWQLGWALWVPPVASFSPNVIGDQALH